MDEKSKYMPRIALGISIISVVLVAASLVVTLSQYSRNEAVRNESRIVELQKNLEQYQKEITLFEDDLNRISMFLEETQQRQLNAEGDVRQTNTRIDSLKDSFSSEVEAFDRRIRNINEIIDALSERIFENESSVLVARSERTQLNRQVTQLGTQLNSIADKAIRNSADISWLQRLSEDASPQVKAKIEALDQEEQKQLATLLRSKIPPTSNLVSDIQGTLNIGQVTFTVAELNELVREARKNQGGN